MITIGITIATAVVPASPNIFAAIGAPRIAKFERQLPWITAPRLTLSLTTIETRIKRNRNDASEAIIQNKNSEALSDPEMRASAMLKKSIDGNASLKTSFSATLVNSSLTNPIRLRRIPNQIRLIFI